MDLECRPRDIKQSTTVKTETDNTKRKITNKISKSFSDVECKQNYRTVKITYLGHIRCFYQKQVFNGKRLAIVNKA